MSKQPSNQAKRNLLRRGLAGILSLALILGLLPSSVVSASAASWADPYVETLVDWGVMRGDIGGNMAPDRSITRAEFVAMMNRAYGYTRLGGHPFTDVRVRDWYNEDIDIGYNIGYFKGTSPTTASPNDTLTREQAAVLLARNMMLQETVGETLGFSDSRSLSDWSRGLVGAAAANGIISGYDDGTFQPFRNITRGEVAAMLVRAIGTPIQTEGEHALGNVYGNVTVNTSGVKLRDGVIVGNLYLTGGIDLGDVLLENVTVLGEIIVSGGGESNSSAASIVMRNVTADNLIVDSIADQFVTIRAEGVTDIPTTTVRTNAYVDDSSLPGYGLSYIELDGDEGTLLQLAGNVKEVWNKTPGSDLQVVQGSAEKITIDEDAVGSSVLVDGDARVDELNLDTATTVTGTGDIKNLNVGAAGSTVEQLPDNITIRPGISADINGSDMNSTQAAESSADPRLLAGYPAVKNIAPNSATLVFRTNKTGTIYWAISAVADGSVSEADLMEPPVYGGNVLQSGTISATSANTDFTAAVTGLTKDGSYYVTAMLVDGRDQHSPIKVTSFSTPDDTVPAFNQGYPYMSRITTENSQVTVSTNKSCLLYYALLPKGSTAPTPAEFKANAITGNLGYGTIDTVKNVTQPFQVNSTRLKELTDYTLYLWLTDYDGAKSSAVISLDFTTPDEQPPVIVEATPAAVSENSAQLTFSLNEAGTLYWAVVRKGDSYEATFEGVTPEDVKTNEVAEPNDRRLQVKIENGAGNSILSGNQSVRAGYTNAIAQIRNLDTAQYGTSFTLYIVAKDTAGNYSKVQKLTIRVKDTTRPTVTLQFDPENESSPKQPSVTATAQLVFSEEVKGVGMPEGQDFKTLYDAVRNATGIDKADAMTAWGTALAKYITLYYGPVGSVNNGNGSAADDRRPVTPVADVCQYNETTGQIEYGSMVDGRFTPSSNWLVNYCAAKVSTKEGRMIVEFPAYNEESADGALKLTSGTQYHFTVGEVIDLSEEANELNPNPTRKDLDFIISPARVLLDLSSESERPPVINEAVYNTNRINRWNSASTNHTIFKAGSVTSKPGDATFTDGVGANTGGIFPQDIVTTHQYWTGKWENLPQRIDRAVTVIPDFTADVVDENMFYDILIWGNKGMDITVYSRPLTEDGKTQPTLPWEWEGVLEYRNTGTDGKTSIFHSLNTMYRRQDNNYQAPLLKDMRPREYAFHVDRLSQSGQYDVKQNTWDDIIELKISVVAGEEYQLNQLSLETSQAKYNEYVPSRVSSIGIDAVDGSDPFIREIRFNSTGAPIITRVDVTRIDPTNADFGFILSAYGRVNYVICQLTNIKYKDKPTDTVVKTHEGTNDPTEVSSIIDKIYGTDTEPRYGAGTLIETADGVYPALEKTGAGIVRLDAAAGGTGTSLVAPNPDTILEGQWPTTPTVLKGQTSIEMPGNPCKPTGLSNFLKPNNAYIIMVVPVGRGDVYNKSVAQCYYFTTPAAKGPILTFTSNTTSEGTANVTAYVDRTATVTSKLFIQDDIQGHSERRVRMLKEKFATIKDQGGNITQQGYTNDAWDALPEAVRNEYKDYTMLDALYESYERNASLRGPAGDYPSLFDVFASDKARSDLYDLIKNPGVPNVEKGYTKPDQITVTQTGDTVEKVGKQQNFILNGPLQRGVDYVCIGIAEGGSGTRSFRATPNISLGDDDGPHIVSVDTSTLVYDETNQTLSGTITIIYDTTLYRVGPNGKKPVAQSPKPVTPLLGNKKYYGMGGVLGMTTLVDIYEKGGNYTEITSLILEAQTSGKTANGNVPIYLQGLADSSPKILNASFTLRYDKDNKCYYDVDVNKDITYTDP